MILKKFALVFAGLLLASVLFFPAQPAAAQGAGEVVLVLPFENVSDHPEYNWIGESFADSMSVLLDKPGLLVVSSDERAVAYQRLRLPLTVIPSRATSIKIAREVKATMLVIGTYSVSIPLAAEGAEKTKAEDRPLANIIVQARVIRVNEGRLSGDFFDAGWAPRQYDLADDVKNLQKMQGELAYQVLFQRDKALPFSRNSLVQEATNVPPQAFEAYMKGSLTGECEPTRAIYFKNALKLYAKDKGGAVYPE